MAQRQRRVHLAAAKRTHQLPRQVRVVADELDRQRALVVVVQRPIDSAELGWRALPQALAEALDARAVLAALQVRELLEHRRRLGRRVLAEVDAAVEFWRQAVERSGHHEPAHAPGRGPIEQDDAHRQVGCFGCGFHAQGTLRGFGGGGGVGGGGTRRADDEPAHGRAAAARAAPELRVHLDLGTLGDIVEHAAVDARRDRRAVATDRHLAASMLVEIDGRRHHGHAEFQRAPVGRLLAQRQRPAAGGRRRVAQQVDHQRQLRAARQRGHGLDRRVAHRRRAFVIGGLRRSGGGSRRGRVLWWRLGRRRQLARLRGRGRQRRRVEAWRLCARHVLARHIGTTHRRHLAAGRIDDGIALHAGRGFVRSPRQVGRRGR